jgi:hypothetical protein
MQDIFVLFEQWKKDKVLQLDAERLLIEFCKWVKDHKTSA